MSHRKQVATSKQYHPVKAVRHLGDNWRYGNGVTLSSGMCVALSSERTEDWVESIHMREMEQGIRDRVEDSWTDI